MIAAKNAVITRVAAVLKTSIAKALLRPSLTGAAKPLGPAAQPALAALTATKPIGHLAIAIRHA